MAYFQILPLKCWGCWFWLTFTSQCFWWGPQGKAMSSPTLFSQGWHCCKFRLQFYIVTVKTGCLRNDHWSSTSASYFNQNTETCHLFYLIHHSQIPNLLILNFGAWRNEDSIYELVIQKGLEFLGKSIYHRDHLPRIYIFP